MTPSKGHPGQDNQDRTLRAGYTGQDTQDRIYGTGHLSQDIQDRKTGIGQAGEISSYQESQHGRIFTPLALLV